MLEMDVERTLAKVAGRADYVDMKLQRLSKVALMTDSVDLSHQDLERLTCPMLASGG